MNEIEKMYKNCKIKKQYCGWLDMGDLDSQYEYIRCDSLKKWKEIALMSRTSYSSEEKDWDKPIIDYPPFTAEKQLELIDWFIRNEADVQVKYDYEDEVYYFKTENDKETIKTESLAEALANLINIYFESFTDGEIEEINEILK